MVALIKQLVIHLHEQLDCVVDQTVDGLVPVGLRVVVERGEHDGQDDRRVLGDQRHDVVVVPVVKSTFGDLKVGRADAFGDLCEERDHHFLEFGGLDDVEDLLQLVEEHHFFRTVRFRPVLQQASANGSES